MSTSPSVSPPRTPGENRLSSHVLAKSTTPTSDDSSIIEDLSFDYVWNDEGNFVRFSKEGLKSTNSSPHTPLEDPPKPDPPGLNPPPSPDVLASPMPKGTLSRSESAYPVLSSISTTAPSSTAAPQNEKSARLFHRTTSGPANLASTAPSQSKPRNLARRVTSEDARERHDSISASRSRQTLDPNSQAYALQEEKENISDAEENPMAAKIQTATLATKQRSSPPLVTRSMSSASARLPPARITYLANSSSGVGSRPLAEVSVPQRTQYSRQNLPGAGRPARIMKTTTASKYTSSSGMVNQIRPDPNDNNIESDSAAGRYSPQVGPVGGDDTEPEDEPPSNMEPAVVPSPTSISSGTAHISSGRSRAPSGLSINVNGGSSVVQPNITRPRRSASLSEAALLNNDEYQLQLQQQYQSSSSRPGTSLGLNAENPSGARRITAQQRERQDAELRAEYKKYQSQDELERRDYDSQSRQSPSPTHNQRQPSLRSAYGHRRRDSDTLRSSAVPSSATVGGSPTVLEGPRGSPPLSSRLQVRYSPSGASKGRVSPPTGKGRASPPGLKGRLSPNPLAARELAKHRRSPTAPEVPTTSAGMKASAQPVGKTWAGAERGDRIEDYDYGVDVGALEREPEMERQRERERDRDLDQNRERERRGHQPHPSLQQYSQSAPSLASSAQSASAPAPLNRHIVVNKKAYARLDMIGKGGSSRVYRVLSSLNGLYAIKRVSLDKTDAETMSGYMNEIALLKRLSGNKRIISLIDSEVKPGLQGSKGHLLLVMECGEIDLAKLLSDRTKEPLDTLWIAYYWQQMLEAVHVIHQEKIVHSDLKPANFVLVRGQLKLIDFGIANAIANDTTNIQRDHQIGTVNYMSPEAIELPDGMRRLKVGRASDVWSLGCILYQMVYGHPPFQHLSVYQKMKAIPDETYDIDYPEYSIPTSSSERKPNGEPVEPPRKLEHLKKKVRWDVIQTIQRCLCRNPKDRAGIDALLEDGWVTMQPTAAASSQPPPPPAPTPSIHDLLKDQEAVIDPHYMFQLLDYGIKLAESGERDPEFLQATAARLVQELKNIRSQ